MNKPHDKIYTNCTFEKMSTSSSTSSDSDMGGFEDFSSDNEEKNPGVAQVQEVAAPLYPTEAENVDQMKIPAEKEDSLSETSSSSSSDDTSSSTESEDEAPKPALVPEPQPEPEPAPEPEPEPSEERLVEFNVPAISLLREVPTDEQVEEALEELRTNKKRPRKAIAEYVMARINRDKVDALYNRDYDKAEECDRLAAIISQKEAEEQQQKAATDWTCDLEERSNEIQDKYKQRMDYWKTRLMCTDKECESKISELQSVQLQEVNEFKAKWQSEEFVRQFNKPSVRLLQLRDIEKKLALQRKYTEAKQMKKMADDVQKQEERDIQRQLQEKMKSDYTKLRQRHKSEIAKLERFYSEQEQDIRLKMKRELDGLEKAMKAMEMKQNAPVKRRYYTPKPRAADDITSMEPTSTIPTPRTLQRFTQYRNERNGTLRIAPMDEATMSRLPSGPIKSRRKRPQTSHASNVPKLVI